MATAITINGITFSFGPDRNVVASSPGIFGGRNPISTIADISTLTVQNITSFSNNPNINDPTKQVLAAFTQTDVDAIKQALSVPPTPTPPPEPVTDTPAETKPAENKASDDGGSPSPPGEPNVQAAGNPETSDPSTTNAGSATNSGTTVAGKAGQSSAKPAAANGKAPTVRPNPLGYFSSYSYQLTLYMVTPDALYAFQQSNRKNINDLVAKSQNGKLSGGAYIVAQSGGINNESSMRAPNFDLDYFIDNLYITNAIGPNDNQASTVTTTLKFTITEPYGFSFLSRLKAASDEIEQYSDTVNIEDLENPSRQFFILGVRFFGYDKYGKLLTGKETIDGRVLDPAGTGGGLFETFYELLIRKVNFKIDGRATVYNIEATSLNIDALSIKSINLPCAVSVTARTVDEAIQGSDGLLTTINKFYADLEYDITPVYKIQYVGELSDLINATLDLPEDITKYKWPIKRDPNDPLGVKIAPDKTRRQISFAHNPGTTILAAIEKIITQSSFLRNAFKATPTNELEPNEQTDADAEIIPDSTKYLRWFNITTKIKVLGYSKDSNQYVYETTFVITPYETPVVISTYVKDLPPYYGPIKRYEYWFTGKNTEIISYEQTNNNGYFIVSLDKDLDSSAGKDIPKVSNLSAPGGAEGGTGNRMQGINTVTSNLYDPKSYANAKMVILGDPDFLMSDSLNFDVGTNAFNQFFAPNGTTVNPTGGQVYIEVDFKEGVDYNYKTGLMDINESITLWQYPESIKSLIKGVSYQIKKVNSTFKSGKFTQELEMFINLLSEDNLKVTGKPDQQRENQPAAGGQRQGTGSPTTAGGTSSSSRSVGLKQDPAVADNTPPASPPESNQTPDNPGTTSSNVPSGSEDGGRE